MKRREFITYSVLAAGALSVAPSCAVSNRGTGKMKKNGKADAGPPHRDPVPMKKSIMWGTVGLKGMSFADACRVIKSAGFDGIEPMSHMDRNEVIDGMAAAGLRASSVCNEKHWSLLLSSPDVQVRTDGIKAQIHAMEDAKAYGTDAVLLVPGRVDANTSYKECWTRSTECIRELVPAAEELGVDICIENVWNDFLLSPMEAKMYLEQFESDRIGWYFDCGNILNLGWPEHWIEILGSRIRRVHIKEFSRTIADSSGRRNGFSPKLGEGEVNWKEVMARLRRSYFGGWLTTEHGPSSTEADLKDLCSRLDRIMAL